MMKRVEINYRPVGVRDDNGGAKVSMRLSRLKARRAIWLNVHLWLGLALGLFLSVLGVTGSILVFWAEIDELLNPTLLTVEAQPGGEGAFRPFTKVFAAADKAVPTNATLLHAFYPRTETSTYRLTYRVPKAGGGEEQWLIGINPYTTQVTGKLVARRSEAIIQPSFIDFIFDLHYSLLAGDTGLVIVGVFGVFLFFSVLTGLLVWWPLTGRFRRALTIKRGASSVRFNHDLHQVSGFYSALVLLLIFLSGIYINLPEEFVGLVKLLSPGTRHTLLDADRPRSAVADGRSSIGMARGLTLASEHLSDGGRLTYMMQPGDGEGAYTFYYKGVPGLSHLWSGREVAVDQYSGEIIEIRDANTRRTAGDALLDWQWPLHSGKIFGWTGRILIFVTGLVCPVLFITGVILWLQKRRAKLHMRRVRS